MRETKFIKQNQEKWAEFEQAMDRTRTDPDQLNELFVQITDDLSYSRTFYTNRSVRVYLNGLAQRIFFKIYRSRRSTVSRLTSFWVEELPKLVYESRSAFRLSFIVFLLAFLIGMVSSAYDAEFLRLILGDAYVDMTLENIESGDPMAVYKQKGAFGMSVGITFNNIFVAFLTFVMGAFFTVGSMAILIRNGIMLGAFQYFFIEQGLFWDSFLTVWIHGTLEISAIIIAGAAGITMGQGLAFPGTYTRAKAFQQSARRGIKIMAGTVPVFIVAGFIEGYLTRHTEVPDVLRGLFIFVCLMFVLLYFAWYPRIKAQTGFQASKRDMEVTPDRAQALKFDRILSSGEIFADVFVFLRKHFGAVVLASLVGAALYLLLAFVPGGESIAARFSFPAGAMSGVQEIEQFFRNDAVPLLPIANTIGLSIVGAVVFRRLQKEEGVRPANLPTTFLKLLVPMSVMAMLLYLVHGGLLLFLQMAILLLPGLWGYISVRTEHNPFSAGLRSFRLFTPNLSRGISLSILFLLVMLLFFSLINTALAWFYLDLFSWVIQLPDEQMAQFSTVVLTFISVWVLFMVAALALVSGGLLYYSLIEIAEAPTLRQQIRDIGLQRRIQGLEKE